MAAINEYNAESVGVVADGILVHPLHTTHYLDEVLFPAIDKGLAKSGRSREDLTIVCPGLPRRRRHRRAGRRRPPAS